MRKILLFFVGFVVIILASIFFIQCSNPQDEVTLEQNYELSKMLGVSDADLDAKLTEMGFVRNEGQLEYRTLDCVPSGNNCYIHYWHVPVYIEDEHCSEPVCMLAACEVSLCLDGTLNFSEFVIEEITCCPELQEYLATLSDHELSTYLDKLYYKASMSLEKYWMIAHLQYGIGAISYFYTNQCYQWCFSLEGRDGPLELRSDDPVSIYASKVNCGEHCCIRYTTWTWKDGKLVSGDPIFTDYGTSECAIWPIAECGRGGRFVGDCEHTCGPL